MKPEVPVRTFSLPAIIPSKKRVIIPIRTTSLSYSCPVELKNNAWYVVNK